MPLILVVEQERRYVERIHDALTADGWEVKVVNDRGAAEAAMSNQSPELVLVTGEVKGAKELIQSLSSRRGGPGTLALLREGDIGHPEFEADAWLEKPFTDQDLRLTVRRVVAAKAGAAESAAGEQLTSQDIFGDLLAEVEDAEQSAPALGPVAEPVALRPPRAEEPSRRAEGTPVKAPKETEAMPDDVERQLEETLSGMLETRKPAKKKAKPGAAPGKRVGSEGVDELLTETLSGLGVRPKRQKKAAPARAEGEAADADIVATVEVPVIAPAPVETMEERAVEVPPEEEAAVSAAAEEAEESVEPPPEAEPTEELEGAPALEPAALVEPAVSSAAEAEELAPPLTPLGIESAAPPGEVAGPTVEAPPPSGAAPEPEGDRQFGQYTLLERIAVGGMAEVWKARMRGVEGFQKNVAIKKILPHLTDSVDFLTMFIDEAKLAAQLNHNNIIHIYDLGKIEDDYYIAMEYVEGKDLRSILNALRSVNRSLPVGLALLIASRLASGLEYAHRKRDFENRDLGLVHRDVSPQNVLISYEGDIKLCDFGIVKAVAKASKTQMGALKGKLQYMSPEQAWGRVVDARSDIFSLGAVLFEMLTGYRLFAGDSEISVLEAVRECHIEGPRAVDGRVPEEVDELVLQALAREPDERFQSAGQMQRRLDGILYAMTPTPDQADLAKYMQELFAVAEPADVAGHAAEVEAPPLATGKPALVVVGVDEAEGEGVEVEAVAPPGDAVIEVEESRGRLWLVAAIFVALAVAVAFIVLRRPGAEPAAQPEAIAEVQTTEGPDIAVPAPPEAGTEALVETERSDEEAGAVEPPPGGQTGAAPEVDVETLVEDQLREREESLRQQLDEEQRRLEEDVRQAQAEAGAPSAEARGEPAPEAATAPAARAPQEVEVAPAQEAGPGPDSGPAGEATGTPRATARPEPSTAPPVEPEPTSTRAEARPPAPAPAKPGIREGDLVEMTTPGLSPPKLLNIQKPDYPPVARRLRVEGTVIVAALVSESGEVVDVRLVQGVDKKVGLNEAALKAAQSARFDPATVEGVRVKVWYNFTIPFRL